MVKQFPYEFLHESSVQKLSYIKINNKTYGRIWGV